MLACTGLDLAVTQVAPDFPASFLAPLDRPEVVGFAVVQFVLPFRAEGGKGLLRAAEQTLSRGTDFLTDLLMQQCKRGFAALDQAGLAAGGAARRGLIGLC